MTLPLQPSGRMLVLAPDRNSPSPKHPKRRDFDHAFKPAAEALQREYSAHVEYIEVPTVDPDTLTVEPGEKQRVFEAAAKTCLRLISEQRPVHLVFLCHGWSTGVQLGFRSAREVGDDARHFTELLELLGEQKTQGLRSVCLFACSAGDEPGSAKTSPGTGDHSLADAIRDGTGLPVIAHWTTGHCTRNADLIAFDASPVPLIGGTAITRTIRGNDGKVRLNPLHRNAVKLLSAGTLKKPNLAGLRPPKGDVRPAWLSLALATSYHDLQALLSQEPAAA